jgi:Leucine-rich repeat (LRR) protein
VDFEHLRNVNLNKNNLASVDKLRNLKFLQSLEARDNCIADNYFMSESKQQLKFLTKVDLAGNKLTKLRQLLCTKLRSLNVDNNEIAECEMVQHSQLHALSANKNKLTSLKGFTDLWSLEVLNLAENQITTLDGIKDCRMLKKLNLQGNQLSEFAVVPDLPSLEEINLANCPIAKLEEIGKLITFKKLNSINLTETPISEEKGDDLKKEVLILLDGLIIKTFNGEEVTEEEITDAKAEKAERIKAAEEARLAAEEEARLAAEEAAKAAAEENE